MMKKFELLIFYNLDLFFLEPHDFGAHLLDLLSQYDILIFQLLINLLIYLSFIIPSLNFVIIPPVVLQMQLLNLLVQINNLLIKRYGLIVLLFFQLGNSVKIRFPLTFIIDMHF